MMANYLDQHTEIPNTRLIPVKWFLVSKTAILMPSLITTEKHKELQNP